MEALQSNLADIVCNELLHAEGVTRFAPNRRSAAVFSEGAPAETLYYVESGLVKLVKRGGESKEILLDIIWAGQLFGEQALGGELARNVAAEILQEGVIHVIPREIFSEFCNARPRLWREVCGLLIHRKQRLEKKIELLCLEDVEYRILFYLAELALSIGNRVSQQEYLIPLSQGELASLIGATRETTSTTLNAIARRGLVRLGRRQLTVLSLDGIRAAVHNLPSAAAAPSD